MRITSAQRCALVLAGLLVCLCPFLAEAAAPDTIAVVVHTNLYPLIETNLNVYVSDLTADGYTVVVKQWDPAAADQNTADELRDYLKTVSQLEGAVFVGTLPIKWYNSTNDWYGANVSFPFDLFFMDLTIEWLDPDTDNYIEGPVTGINPTIWVSRIKCGGMTVFPGQSEADLINNYFQKVHRFRTGELRLPDRALLWADEDWDHYTASYCVGYAYTNVTRVSRALPGITTDRTDWESRWQHGYETEWFMCHSSASSHSPGGSSVGCSTVANADIRRLFWNCWNCSSAKYSSGNYVAGVRLFTPKYGLAVIGTTKTGSMLSASTFYSRLNTDNSHGVSFLEWFKLNSSGLLWHRGMTLLGDGTLKLGRFTHAANPGNQPPTVSSIPNVDADEDIRSDPIAFTIGDDSTPASNLICWAESADRTMMPSHYVQFGGSDTSRTFTVLSAANKVGSVTVTVSVCDGELTTSQDLLVTFNPMNDNPTCTLTDPSVDHDVFLYGAPISLTATVTDLEGNSSVTNVEFYLDGTNICRDLYDGNTTYTGTTEVLSLGTHSIYGRAYDNVGGAGSSASFNIRVLDVLGGDWSNQDIGAPKYAGVSGMDGGTTVVAGGGDIAGTNDFFQFVYQRIKGDGTITAKILTFENTDNDAKAGVMIRQSLNPGSRYVFAKMRRYGYRSRLQCRLADDGVTTSLAESANLSLPHWVMLTKTGEVVTAYRSNTGTNWTSMGTVTNAMGGSFYVGLAVAAKDNNDLCTVQFDNISVAADSDGDGDPDVTDLDDDNDDLPDAWERVNGLDSLNAADRDEDTDKDGLLNWEEYVAGTLPNDPTSYFAVIAVSNQSPAVVCFQGLTGRLYAVECRDSLIGTNGWDFLTNDMPGANGVMGVNDPAGVPCRFYRIKVWMDEP